MLQEGVSGSRQHRLRRIDGQRTQARAPPADQNHGVGIAHGPKYICCVRRFCAHTPGLARSESSPHLQGFTARGSRPRLHGQGRLRLTGAGCGQSGPNGGGWMESFNHASKFWHANTTQRAGLPAPELDTSAAGGRKDNGQPIDGARATSSRIRFQPLWNGLVHD